MVLIHHCMILIRFWRIFASYEHSHNILFLMEEIFQSTHP